MLHNEVEFCTQFGPASLGALEVRELMRLRFPERDYDGSSSKQTLEKGP